MATNDDIAREYARARFDEFVSDLRNFLRGMTATIGTEAPPCYWQRAQTLGFGAIVFEPGSDEVRMVPDTKHSDYWFTAFQITVADESHSVDVVWEEMFEDYYQSREWVPDNQWS